MNFHYIVTASGILFFIVSKVITVSLLSFFCRALLYSPLLLGLLVFFFLPCRERRCNVLLNDDIAFFVLVNPTEDPNRL